MFRVTPIEMHLKNGTYLRFGDILGISSARSVPLCPENTVLGIVVLPFPDRMVVNISKG